jgi:hypothetical protein
MSRVGEDKVAIGLSELATLDRSALVDRWATVFGCPAPKHAHLGLLHGALAWRLQLEAQAGAGQVDRLVRGLRRSTARAAPPTPLSPGTRLLREWQGRTHHVTVLAQGFEHDGRTYKSLTAIARHITGTAWSGPLFFGLRS